MKKSIGILLMAIFAIYSCSSDSSSNSENVEVERVESTPVEETTAEVDPMQDKGIGPISSVELGEIDETMAAEGKETFKTLCSACHKIEKRFVGPALLGVTERRTPEWIMNMIMNPEEMVEKNKIAKDLLAEYLSPMANQNVSEEDARKILEYFRSEDNKQ
ncbi:MAG: cytochrome c [Chitinophagales bacterium]